MTKFNETAEGLAFIGSAASRETDTRIMEAIAFFALNMAEAEALWNGDFEGVCNPSDLWENATGNGLIDANDMAWGQTTLAAVVNG